MYILIFRGLDVRGGRKLRTDTHTHTHTHTYTHTRDNYSNPRCVHVCRGLIICVVLTSLKKCCYRRARSFHNSIAFPSYARRVWLQNYNLCTRLLHKRYSIRQKNLSISPCLTTVNIVWSRPLCERGGTVSQPFHFSGRTLQTRCAALHNYRVHCSGITFSRYCGIGTLYFKILTMVTAIIWQPGH